MTAPPLRVALWAPVPPPLGGIGRWTLRYVDAAPAHGLDVQIVDISPRDAAFSERSAFRFGRARTAGRALWDLGRVLRRHRPQLCHVTSSLFWATPRDGAALALCRAAGVPTVLHLRGSNQFVEWREALPRLQRAGLDAVLGGATCVLVLSRELEDYLRRVLPGRRVERIGNMVDEPLPGAALLPPRGQGSAGPRQRVLFVGAVTPLKGVGELAEAVLALPDVELALIGGSGGAIDPERRRAMDAHLARLRATGRLYEAGELPPEQVARAYSEADVFALPTHREGLPNVLLEAMAAGTPCVVTAVGAIPDVIQGELALQVPVGDAAALRSALARLLGDPALRADLAARARRSVLERYGVGVVMAQYRALYEDLLR